MGSNKSIWSLGDATMASSVVVAGVDMIPFRKPGSSAPCHVMGAQAARLALADAGLDS